MAEIGLKELLRYLSPFDLPLFVSQIRYLVHTSGNPYRIIQERIVLLFMLFCLLRLGAILFALIIGDSEWFHHLIFFGNHLLRNETVKLFFNTTFIAILFLLLLYVTIFYKIFISIPDDQYWHELYSLTVINYEQFLKHNSAYLAKLFDSIPGYFGLYRKLLYCRTVLNCLWQGDPEFSFGNDRLSVMPGCSLRTRTRILRVLFHTEVLANIGTFSTSKTGSNGVNPKKHFSPLSSCNRHWLLCLLCLRYDWPLSGSLVFGLRNRFCTNLLDGCIWSEICRPNQKSSVCK